jgi:hypothetical protein
LTRKLVGVFVRFRAPLSGASYMTDDEVRQLTR